MDGARLQTKVFGGFAKAAKRIGVPFDLYRPDGAFDPLNTFNKVTTLPAAFTRHGASNFDFSQPSDHKQPLFHAMVDAAQIQAFDYLNNPNDVYGPFFIASVPPSMPPLAVQCNRTVSVYQPGPALSHGLNGYAGTTPGNGTLIMSGWPASVLMGARGVRDQTLPADAGYGSYRIMLPFVTGVYLRPGTIITDDISNRFIVQVAELQDLGWRIDAVQAVT